MRRWTKKETTYLAKSYGEIPVLEIANQLCRSNESIEKKAAKLGLKSKRPGSKMYAHPHNKGKRWKAREEHPAWRPVGEPWEAAGRMWIKRSRDSTPEPYARWLMEQAGHDIAGKIVVHIDGDTMNCSLENLMAIDRKQNARRNYRPARDKALAAARMKMTKTGRSLVDLILMGEFVTTDN